jgi:glucokinase
LENIVNEFLSKRKILISSASFGIAGPVSNGKVQATNLPWLVTEIALSKELSVPVRILNDLSATAHAIPYLDADEVLLLKTGKSEKQGTIGVIAPGTGLGEAYLTWGGNRYRAFSSEGGHADFAPVNDLQIRLLMYMQKHFGHVSYERVCSGKGIVNIYGFLKNIEGFLEPDWLKNQIMNLKDPTPIITKSALEKSSEIAIETMSLFVSILGSEAGNMALRLMSTGGIYLGGGIPPRIIPFLEMDSFMENFSAKGRFDKFLKDIPISLIKNPEAALLGAACFGLEERIQNGKNGLDR